jgi:hypothetical protein
VRSSFECLALAKRAENMARDARDPIDEKMMWNAAKLWRRLAQMSAAMETRAGLFAPPPPPIVEWQRPQQPGRGGR